MTDKINDLRKAVEEASTKIYQAYWSACDAAQAAVDPADVVDDAWAIDLLAESYDIALRIEADQLGWEEGRSKW